VTPGIRERFSTVVLDVDSTLCGIEGVDWLAKRRSPEIATLVAAETNRAMRGDKPLEAVYGARLDAVRPSAKDVLALSLAYSGTIAPGARVALAKWRAVGIETLLISSGIRQAVLPVAEDLGIPAESVFAVDLKFDADGSYAGFDEHSPLATAMGKRDLLASIAPGRPILAVGDGSTDAAMRSASDAFAAFTGFVARHAIMSQADFVVSSFDQLDEIVLGVAR
jgi:phosphoserine phosphatase